MGPDLATPHWVAYFADQLVGRNPLEIERAWAMMYQGARFPPGSSGMAAISGIEQSLWDIAGKARGVPVYQLLGGKVRDRIRAYHGVGGESPDELAENGRGLVDGPGFHRTQDRTAGPRLAGHDMGSRAARRTRQARRAEGGCRTGYRYRSGRARRRLGTGTGARAFGCPFGVQAVLHGRAAAHGKPPGDDLPAPKDAVRAGHRRVPLHEVRIRRT